MIKIGLVSGNNVSKSHLNAINQSSDFDLVGLYNPTVSDLNVYDDLLNETDAIGILSPTFSHYEYASKAIRKLKHVFVENPISKTLDEARSLISLSEEADITVQIGHAERFNPAFLAIKDEISNPLIIEAKRFENVGKSNKSVVLDLMIHDIDIILNVVNSNVKSVRANGFSHNNTTPDIVNARIEFDNGCVANLSASIVATKAVKKLHIFESQKQISINFNENKSRIINLKTGELFDSDHLSLLASHSTEKEFENFADAINNNKPLDVCISNGYNSLNVATQILDKLKVNGKVTL